MIALALDTSGAAGSVAVVVAEGGADGVRTAAARTIDDGMRRGVELFPAIDDVLARAGVRPRDVDVVAVGTGPGSYTGLRVGITAARALAYAAGTDILGVPSCDALATAAPSGCDALAVVTDTRVRSVYLALYAPGEDGRWERRAGPEILSPDEAARRIPEGALVVGDGPRAHAQAFAALAGRATAGPDSADAAAVGRLALAARARGARQRIDDVVPLYLRKTEAERKLEGDPR